MPASWIRYPILYLLITAAAGVTLRGMALLPSLPDQYDKLLHAHSHIALLGWGYTALFLLYVSYLVPVKEQGSRFIRWNWLLTQLTIVLMFVAFLCKAMDFSRSCFQPYIFFYLLWMDVAWGWYLVAVIAGIAQLLAIVILLSLWSKLRQHAAGSVFIRFAMMNLAVKILLELGSAIPALDTLVFTNRSVVVGYLHLVLLGFVSCMLAGFLLRDRPWDHYSKLLRLGTIVFIAGFIGMSRCCLASLSSPSAEDEVHESLRAG